MSLPFGVAEMLELLPGGGDVLDVGCGSGRLTAALADRGWQATGMDTSALRLAAAEERSDDVHWLGADMNEPLPFGDAAFDAVVSRLSLMIARDHAGTLRELRRVLRPGGVVVTAVWAAPERNPWFCLPRDVVGDVLGVERGAFARRFGQLGTEDELLAVHRDGGFAAVTVTVVAGEVEVTSAEAHWVWLTQTIGHYQRLDAALTTAERARVLAELSSRLGGATSLARTQLVASEDQGSEPL
jgi:SAM-dependent methyltransferase